MPALPIMYTVVFGKLFVAHHTAARVWQAPYRSSYCRSRLAGCISLIVVPVAFGRPSEAAYRSSYCRRGCSAYISAIILPVAFARFLIGHPNCRSRLEGCRLPSSSTVAFGKLIRGRLSSVVRTSKDGRVARSAPEGACRIKRRWRRADTKRSLSASPRSCSAS